MPLSRLAECVNETKLDLVCSHLPAPLVGHVGDGNFHLFIVFDPDGVSAGARIGLADSSFGAAQIRRILPRFAG